VDVFAVRYKGNAVPFVLYFQVPTVLLAGPSASYPCDLVVPAAHLDELLRNSACTTEILVKCLVLGRRRVCISIMPRRDHAEPEEISFEISFPAVKLQKYISTAFFRCMTFTSQLPPSSSIHKDESSPNYIRAKAT